MYFLNLAVKGLILRSASLWLTKNIMYCRKFVIVMCFIAAEHRRRSETNSVNGIEIEGKISSFFLSCDRLWANCNADQKWVWFTQTAVSARCFCCQRARLPNSTLQNTSRTKFDKEQKHNRWCVRLEYELSKHNSNANFDHIKRSILAHHSPGPRIVLQLGPLHSRVLLLFPRLFPAVFSVRYPGLASCVMRHSTSLLLENY